MDLFDGAVSKVKSIYELAKLLGNSDLLLQISNLQIELADLKSSYADLTNENRELKQKIQGLEESREEPPVYKNGAYYSQNGDGPFCSGCYDKDKKLIRLSKLGTQMRLASHICPVCKGAYKLTK